MWEAEGATGAAATSSAVRRYAPGALIPMLIQWQGLCISKHIGNSSTVRFRQGDCMT